MSQVRSSAIAMKTDRSRDFALSAGIAADRCDSARCRGDRLICTSAGLAQFAGAAASALPHAAVTCTYLDLYRANLASIIGNDPPANLRIECAPICPTRSRRRRLPLFGRRRSGTDARPHSSRPRAAADRRQDVSRRPTTPAISGCAISLSKLFASSNAERFRAGSLVRRHQDRAAEEDQELCV